MRKLWIVLLGLATAAGLATLFGRRHELLAPPDDEAPPRERAPSSGAPRRDAVPAASGATTAVPASAARRAEADAVADEVAQCTATTKSGKRCQREALPGMARCWQHA